MTKLALFFLLLFSHVYGVTPNSLREALDHYESTRSFDQSPEEFWEYPECYFIKRIQALDAVIAFSEFDQELRTSLQAKRNYLEALVPFAADFRCTKSLMFKTLYEVLNVDDHYWPELIDPLHRAGPEVQLRIALWQVSNVPNYFIFLETIENDQGLNSYAPFRHYIKYCKTEQERESFKLRFVDGRAYLNDDLFDTKNSNYIFALGTDGQFYVNHELKYERHHSTFLGGKEVLCAGEITAQQGVITRISNKSGHYQPTAAAVVPVLEILQRLTGSVKGIVLELKIKKGVGLASYDAEQFLQNKGLCPALADTTNGYTPLHLAIVQKQIQIAGQVLNPESINQQNILGDTPLHLAVRANAYDWTILLMQAGADPVIANKSGKSPLHEAAYLKNLSLLKQLIGTSNQWIALEDYPLLHAAASGGALNVVHYLIESGAHIEACDRSGGNVLHASSLCDNPLLVDFFLEKGIVPCQDFFGATPLHRAAAQGNEKVFIKLLSICDPMAADHQGNTILHYAAREGNYRLMPHIILLCPKELAEKVNHKGELPLHWAAEKLPCEFTRQLLSMGISPDAPDAQGQTPAHYAAKTKNSISISNLESLRQSGGSLDLPDVEGLFPVHQAILSGNIVHLMYLLSWTENCNIKDPWGRSLLEFAIHYKKREIKKYLLQLQLNDCN